MGGMSKGTGNSETDGEEWKCKFCPYSHPLKKEKCPAWGKTCVFCEELDHVAIKCPKKKDAQVNLVTDDYEASSGEEEWVNMVKSELLS